MAESINKKDLNCPPPFRGTLEDTRFSERIKKIQANPDLLVREWHFEYFGKDEEERKKFEEEELKHFKQGMAVFKNLQERYGLSIPRMDIVIGRREGIKTIFTVTDRIYGENLLETKILPPSAFEKAEALFEGIARHYLDVLKEGGDYWWDIKSSQFIWGHKQGEEENQMYLVDIESRFYTYKKDSKESMADMRDEAFFNVFKKVVYSMTAVEHKFVPPKKFIRARQLLKKVLLDYSPRYGIAYENSIAPAEKILKE